MELKFLFVNVCTYDLAYHFFWGGGGCSWLKICCLWDRKKASIAYLKRYYSFSYRVNAMRSIIFIHKFRSTCEWVSIKKNEPQMFFPIFLCSHQDFADPLYTEGGTFHLVMLSFINSFVHKTISSTDQCVSCFKYQLMTMFCIWNLKVSYWFLLAWSAHSLSGSENM